jgi:hypothetical protein
VLDVAVVWTTDVAVMPPTVTDGAVQRGAGPV